MRILAAFLLLSLPALAKKHPKPSDIPKISDAGRADFWKALEEVQRLARIQDSAIVAVNVEAAKLESLKGKLCPGAKFLFDDKRGQPECVAPDVPVDGSKPAADTK